MRNAAIPAAAVALLLAGGALPATAQGWVIHAGAGLAHIGDQLDGPALGALGLRLGVTHGALFAYGLEVAHYRFGESAAASICVDTGCTESRYEGTLQTSVTEVQGVARYGGAGPLLPYVVVTAGWVRTDERRDYNGVQENAMQGISGSVGVGWVPLVFRVASLGIEGRLHGLIVGDDEGEPEVGLGTYYTLLAVLRFRPGG